MQKLNLEKVKKGNITYSRVTAQRALENVIQRIEKANNKKDFIYKITKAVLFGSYINSDKDKVGDLDIALYIELKDKSKDEIEQNFERARTSINYVPFLMRFIYGKEEVFRYIKDKKRVLQLHYGNKVDEDAKNFNEPISYIYINKHKVIYEWR